MKTLAVLILCLASVALADDFKTIDGKEYKAVKVSRVEPDGIVLITKSGISKVYFTELPKEVQDRFHYDPRKAAEFSSQTIEQNRLYLQQRAQEEQKRAEERTKYWSEHPMPSLTTGRPELNDAATDQRQPINRSVLIGRINPVEGGILLHLTSAALIGQDRLAPGVYVFLSGSFPGFYDNDLVQAVAVQTGVRDSDTLGARISRQRNLRAFDVLQITKLPY
jgi:hypothetical protein